jgi:hypothetical protein
MALSKLDLAAVAVLAVGMLWIEHEHRIIVATPMAAEAVSATSVCPETDDVPFSADCIAFIDGAVLPDGRLQINTRARAASPGVQRRTELNSPACPVSNENTPYSEDCLKFLSGWYWQANPTDSAP